MNWSSYILLLSGAASMFLASHAFQAGSLSASQPGLTVVDPLVASALGVALFGERLNVAPAHLAGELAALAVLVGSVVLLSRSPLVRDVEPYRNLESKPPVAQSGLPETNLALARRRDAQMAPRGRDYGCRTEYPFSHVLVEVCDPDVAQS
jgi:hypothetical protein